MSIGGNCSYPLAGVVSNPCTGVDNTAQDNLRFNNPGFVNVMARRRSEVGR